MERDHFYVGVHALVIKDNKILLGKRKNVYAEGQYGLPGGHLENHESIEQAVARELLEETGLTCESFIFSNVVNEPEPDNKHYIFFGFLAQNIKGEPALTEPDKCYGWEWFDLDNLPENTVTGHRKHIEAYLNHKNFIDS